MELFAYKVQYVACRSVKIPWLSIFIQVVARIEFFVMQPYFRGVANGIHQLYSVNAGYNVKSNAKSNAKSWS
jgi:hypothetical protein